MQNVGIIEKKETDELNLSGIKNIIFDLGGVIIDIHYQKTIAQFKSIGFTEFETIYSQLKQTHLFDLLETGKIPPQSFCMELQKFQNQATSEQIKTAWNSMIGELPYQHVNLLKLLRKRYRTFLLSNTNAIHIEYFLNCMQEKFNYDPLPEMFEHAYYSHEIGYRKPDTNAYNYVLRDTGIKASETIFIDDLEVNIAGAEEAGLHTYHLSERSLQSIFKQF